MFVFAVKWFRRRNLGRSLSHGVRYGKGKMAARWLHFAPVGVLPDDTVIKPWHPRLGLFRLLDVSFDLAAFEQHPSREWNPFTAGKGFGAAG
jgi:hypothetical protein